MQHIKTIVNFHKVDPFPELIYDHTLATLGSQVHDLARFVKTYYKQDWSDFNEYDFYKSWKSYQEMINMAIKSENLIGLETLWQGIYFHDRNNPDYETDAYTAAEFGSLQMFQHVLYGYMNYATLNASEDLELDKLKKLATSNPNSDVLVLIDALACCVNQENKIRSFPNCCLEDNGDSDDDEEKDWRASAKKFYDCVGNFTSASA